MTESHRQGSYVWLCVCGMVSVTWKEGTKTESEFAVDSERWRSSLAFVDAVVHRNPKRCKRESCVALVNISTEFISLGCCRREKVNELLRRGYHGW